MVKDILLSLVALAIAGNYVYWIFFSKKPPRPSDSEDNERIDQTFSL